MTWLLAAVIAGPSLAGTLAGWGYPHADGRRYAWWALGDGLTVPGLLVLHAWPAAAMLAALAAWWAWQWWNRRRKSRAKAWLGAKSKAVRDALVRKLREARKPRPVLRPAPQGGMW